MITKLRKYWITASIAYQERFGRCADNKNVMGAEANMVLFRITASDAQELAPELTAQSDDGEREP